MRRIEISDMTLKFAAGTESNIHLNFREKIEIAKLLDRLNVSVIELPAIENTKVDSLLVKSVAMSVKNSIVALPVGIDQDSIALAAAALRDAKHARLQVCAPMSTVQMEYFRHKKPEAMLSQISQQIAACRAVCGDVEFIADDACRADADFVCRAVQTAADAGAGVITLCDSAGLMFPDEMSAFIRQVRAGLSEGFSARLGIQCSDSISMADACACAAVREGVDVVKTIACDGNMTGLKAVSDIFFAKGANIGGEISLRSTEIRRGTDSIKAFCKGISGKSAGVETVMQEETSLSVHDSRDEVMKVIAQMGYTLSDEDLNKVYEAFANVASKKEKVSGKELDSIIAAVAMQVPETYTLINYVISSGNRVAASAHIILQKDGVQMEGVSLGDGPIDAAFHSIEQIAGKHFELDDFGVRAVTGGREAMGETVIRLRSQGKLYSGCGISTDIVDASIRAYLSALNKIVYEEDEA